VRVLSSLELGVTAAWAEGEHDRGRSGPRGRIERNAEAVSGGHYPPAFWWYLIGAGLVGFGFADYSLIAYHFSEGQTVPPTWVPVFYALAMGASGLGSLIFGKALRPDRLVHADACHAYRRRIRAACVPCRLRGGADRRTVVGHRAGRP
jgi:hypothetical protein